MNNNNIDHHESSNTPDVELTSGDVTPKLDKYEKMGFDEKNTATVTHRQSIPVTIPISERIFPCDDTDAVSTSSAQISSGDALLFTNSFGKQLNDDNVCNLINDNRRNSDTVNDCEKFIEMQSQIIGCIVDTQPEESINNVNNLLEHSIYSQKDIINEQNKNQVKFDDFESVNIDRKTIFVNDESTSQNPLSLQIGSRQQYYLEGNASHVNNNTHRKPTVETKKNNEVYVDTVMSELFLTPSQTNASSMSLPQGSSAVFESLTIIPDTPHSLLNSAHELGGIFPTSNMVNVNSSRNKYGRGALATSLASHSINGSTSPTTAAGILTERHITQIKYDSIEKNLTGTEHEETVESNPIMHLSFNDRSDVIVPVDDDDEDSHNRNSSSIPKDSADVNYLPSDDENIIAAVHELSKTEASVNVNIESKSITHPTLVPAISTGKSDNVVDPSQALVKKANKGDFRRKSNVSVGSNTRNSYSTVVSHPTSKSASAQKSASISHFGISAVKKLPLSSNLNSINSNGVSKKNPAVSEIINHTRQEFGIKSNSNKQLPTKTNASPRHSISSLTTIKKELLPPSSPSSQDCHSLTTSQINGNQNGNCLSSGSIDFVLSPASTARDDIFGKAGSHQYMLDNNSLNNTLNISSNNFNNEFVAQHENQEATMFKFGLPNSNNAILSSNPNPTAMNSNTNLLISSSSSSSNFISGPVSSSLLTSPQHLNFSSQQIIQTSTSSSLSLSTSPVIHNPTAAAPLSSELQKTTKKNDQSSVLSMNGNKASFEGQPFSHELSSNSNLNNNASNLTSSSLSIRLSNSNYISKNNSKKSSSSVIYSPALPSLQPYSNNNENPPSSFKSMKKSTPFSLLNSNHQTNTIMNHNLPHRSSSSSPSPLNHFGNGHTSNKSFIDGAAKDRSIIDALEIENVELSTKIEELEMKCKQQELLCRSLSIGKEAAEMEIRNLSDSLEMRNEVIEDLQTRLSKLQKVHNIVKKELADTVKRRLKNNILSDVSSEEDDDLNLKLNKNDSFLNNTFSSLDNPDSSFKNKQRSINPLKLRVEEDLSEEETEIKPSPSNRNNNSVHDTDDLSSIVKLHTEIATHELQTKIKRIQFEKDILSEKLKEVCKDNERLRDDLEAAKETAVEFQMLSLPRMLNSTLGAELVLKSSIAASPKAKSSRGVNSPTSSASSSPSSSSYSSSSGDSSETPLDLLLLRHTKKNDKYDEQLKNQPILQRAYTDTPKLSVSTHENGHSGNPSNAKSNNNNSLFRGNLLFASNRNLMRSVSAVGSVIGGGTMQNHNSSDEDSLGIPDNQTVGNKLLENEINFSDKHDDQFINPLLSKTPVEYHTSPGISIAHISVNMAESNDTLNNERKRNNNVSDVNKIKNQNVLSLNELLLDGDDDFACIGGDENSNGPADHSAAQTPSMAVIHNPSRSIYHYEGNKEDKIEENAQQEFSHLNSVNHVDFALHSIKNNKKQLENTSYDQEPNKNLTSSPTSILTSTSRNTISPFKSTPVSSNNNNNTLTMNNIENSTIEQLSTFRRNNKRSHTFTPSSTNSVAITTALMKGSSQTTLNSSTQALLNTTSNHSIPVGYPWSPVGRRLLSSKSLPRSSMPARGSYLNSLYSDIATSNQLITAEQQANMSNGVGAVVHLPPAMSARRSLIHLQGFDEATLRRAVEAREEELRRMRRQFITIRMKESVAQKKARNAEEAAAIATAKLQTLESKMKVREDALKDQERQRKIFIKSAPPITRLKALVLKLHTSAQAFKQSTVLNNHHYVHPTVPISLRQQNLSNSNLINSAGGVPSSVTLLHGNSASGIPGPSSSPVALGRERMIIASRQISASNLSVMHQQQQTPASSGSNFVQQVFVGRNSFTGLNSSGLSKLPHLSPTTTTINSNFKSLAANESPQNHLKSPSITGVKNLKQHTTHQNLTVLSNGQLITTKPSPTLNDETTSLNNETVAIVSRQSSANVPSVYNINNNNNASQQLLNINITDEQQRQLLPAPQSIHAGVSGVFTTPNTSPIPSPHRETIPELFYNHHNNNHGGNFGIALNTHLNTQQSNISFTSNGLNAHIEKTTDLFVNALDRVHNFDEDFNHQLNHWNQLTLAREASPSCSSTLMIPSDMIMHGVCTYCYNNSMNVINGNAPSEVSVNLQQENLSTVTQFNNHIIQTSLNEKWLIFVRETLSTCLAMNTTIEDIALMMPLGASIQQIQREVSINNNSQFHNNSNHYNHNNSQYHRTNESENSERLESSSLRNKSFSEHHHHNNGSNLNYTAIGGVHSNTLVGHRVRSERQNSNASFHSSSVDSPSSRLNTSGFLFTTSNQHSLQNEIQATTVNNVGSSVRTGNVRKSFLKRPPIIPTNASNHSKFVGENSIDDNEKVSSNNHNNLVDGLTLDIDAINDDSSSHSTGIIVNSSFIVNNEHHSSPAPSARSSLNNMMTASHYNNGAVTNIVKQTIPMAKRTSTSNITPIARHSILSNNNEGKISKNPKQKNIMNTTKSQLTLSNNKNLDKPDVKVAPSTNEPRQHKNSSLNSKSIKRVVRRDYEEDNLVQQNMSENCSIIDHIEIYDDVNINRDTQSTKHVHDYKCNHCGNWPFNPQLMDQILSILLNNDVEREDKNNIFPNEICASGTVDHSDSTSNDPNQQHLTASRAPVETSSSYVLSSTNMIQSSNSLVTQKTFESHQNDTIYGLNGLTALNLTPMGPVPKIPKVFPPLGTNSITPYSTPHQNKIMLSDQLNELLFDTKSNYADDMDDNQILNSTFLSSQRQNTTKMNSVITNLKHHDATISPVNRSPNNRLNIGSQCLEAHETNGAANSEHMDYYYSTKTISSPVVRIGTDENIGKEHIRKVLSITIDSQGMVKSSSKDKQTLYNTQDDGDYKNETFISLQNENLNFPSSEKNLGYNPHNPSQLKQLPPSRVLNISSLKLQRISSDATHEQDDLLYNPDLQNNKVVGDKHFTGAVRQDETTFASIVDSHYLWLKSSHANQELLSFDILAESIENKVGQWSTTAFKHAIKAHVLAIVVLHKWYGMKNVHSDTSHNTEETENEPFTTAQLLADIFEEFSLQRALQFNEKIDISTQSNENSSFIIYNDQTDEAAINGNGFYQLSQTDNEKNDYSHFDVAMPLQNNDVKKEKNLTLQEIQPLSISVSPISDALNQLETLISSPLSAEHPPFPSSFNWLLEERSHQLYPSTLSEFRRLLSSKRHSRFITTSTKSEILAPFDDHSEIEISSHVLASALVSDPNENAYPQKAAQSNAVVKSAAVSSNSVTRSKTFGSSGLSTNVNKKTTIDLGYKDKQHINPKLSNENANLNAFTTSTNVNNNKIDNNISFNKSKAAFENLKDVLSTITLYICLAALDEQCRNLNKNANIANEPISVKIDVSDSILNTNLGATFHSKNVQQNQQDHLLNSSVGMSPNLLVYLPSNHLTLNSIQSTLFNPHPYAPLDETRPFISTTSTPDARQSDTPTPLSSPQKFFWITSAGHSSVGVNNNSTLNHLDNDGELGRVWSGSKVGFMIQSLIRDLNNLQKYHHNNNKPAGNEDILINPSFCDIETSVYKDILKAHFHNLQENENISTQTDDCSTFVPTHYEKSSSSSSSPSRSVGIQTNAEMFSLRDDDKLFDAANMFEHADEKTFIDRKMKCDSESAIQSSCFERILCCGSPPNNLNQTNFNRRSSISNNAAIQHIIPAIQQQSSQQINGLPSKFYRKHTKINDLSILYQNNVIASTSDIKSPKIKHESPSHINFRDDEHQSPLTKLLISPKTTVGMPLSPPPCLLKTTTLSPILPKHEGQYEPSYRSSVQSNKLFAMNNFKNNLNDGYDSVSPPQQHIQYGYKSTFIPPLTKNITSDPICEISNNQDQSQTPGIAFSSKSRNNLIPSRILGMSADLSVNLSARMINNAPSYSNFNIEQQNQERSNGNRMLPDFNTKKINIYPSSFNEADSMTSRINNITEKAATINSEPLVNEVQVQLSRSKTASKKKNTHAVATNSARASSDNNNHYQVNSNTTLKNITTSRSSSNLKLKTSPARPRSSLATSNHTTSNNHASSSSVSLAANSVSNGPRSARGSLDVIIGSAANVLRKSLNPTIVSGKKKKNN